MGRKLDPQTKVERAVGDLFAALYLLEKRDTEEAYEAAGIVFNMIVDYRGDIRRKLISNLKLIEHEKEVNNG